jgi:hypothetical protein
VKYPRAIVIALVSPEFSIAHETEVEHDASEEHGKPSFVCTTKQRLAEDVHHDVGDKSKANEALPPFLATPHECHGEHHEHSDAIEHESSP